MSGVPSFEPIAPVRHAHGYAALDWPVFPLSPGQKVPLYANPHRPGSDARAACRGRWSWAGCGRDGHGVLDATTDHEVIDRWWSRTPSANVGLACGVTAAGHGPDVVDFDVKGGARGADSFERLRDAGLLAGAFGMASTPSGGWHLYYEGSTQGNGVVRGFGVDFRSRGGYVVAVGCPAGAGRYAWTWGPCIPDRGVDWLAIRHYLKPPPPIRPIEAMHRENDVTIDGLASWVGQQGARSENRNNGLFWAACKALEDGHGQDALDALADSARGNGLPEDEIRKSVNSAVRRSMRRVTTR